MRTELALEDRRCLFCLAADGAFTTEEHVVPRMLGPDTDRFVIAPGTVCDDCNTWLGRQVDAPFGDRFDMRLSRGLEGLRPRKGGAPHMIDGRDATARVTVELDGREVTIDAARADPTPSGGLALEIRPLRRDPPDIVARTIRALWKIALGAVWLSRGEEALDPRLDPLRRAVLGAPFNGYLLQAPFTARVTRRLEIDVNVDHPHDPWAMVFVLGGVALAVPLAEGAAVRRADARGRGWDLHLTTDAAPAAVHLRVEPDRIEPAPEG